MSDKKIEVPRGYLQDAKGNLVARKNVRSLDLKRDALVRVLWREAEKASEHAAQVRAKALSGIDALVLECADEYGVRVGGSKGNVVLTSYDGCLRVTRARADTITFTEQIEVARSLVHECLVGFSKGANRNLKALVESAFAIDEKGNVSVSRILRLRQVKIDDEKWTKAMQIIGESMRVVATREYVRFYKRNEEGVYEHVPISFLEEK